MKVKDLIRIYFGNVNIYIDISNDLFNINFEDCFSGKKEDIPTHLLEKEVYCFGVSPIREKCLNIEIK